MKSEAPPIAARGTAPRYVDLQAGDPAPFFEQRTFANPKFNFDTAAGRYLVLCFLGSSADPDGAAAISAALARPDMFNDSHASFFGVTFDSDDKERLKEQYPGYRYFLDFDGSVGRLYGALAVDEPSAAEPRVLRRLWIVLDPTLRVIAAVPFGHRGGHSGLVDWVAALPPPGSFAGFSVAPPVLVLPNVFDQALCKRLIDAYEQAGREMSGFMCEENGKTVLRHNEAHKRRRDHNLTDPALIGEARRLIHRRVVPEIRKVHQFEVTRMERHLVGCYTAEDRGHFRPHRDNTNKGTAHRRFAVSVNLNAEFEGGRVGFPEYGPQTFKPPPGGAVVFSCFLLHTVTPVTSGRRYAFLPFLYDEAAARLREANAAFLEGSTYRSGLTAGA